MMHEHFPTTSIFESIRNLTNHELATKLAEGTNDANEREAVSWGAMDRILDKIGVSDSVARDEVMNTPLSGRNGPLTSDAGAPVLFGDYLGGVGQQHPGATEMLAGFLAVEPEDPNYDMYVGAIRETIEGYIKQPLPQA